MPEGERRGVRKVRDPQSNARNEEVYPVYPLPSPSPYVVNPTNVVLVQAGPSIHIFSSALSSCILLNESGQGSGRLRHDHRRVRAARRHKTELFERIWEGKGGGGDAGWPCVHACAQCTARPLPSTLFPALRCGAPLWCPLPFLSLALFQIFG